MKQAGEPWRLTTLRLAKHLSSLVEQNHRRIRLDHPRTLQRSLDCNQTLTSALLAPVCAATALLGLPGCSGPGTVPSAQVAEVELRLEGVVDWQAGLSDQELDPGLGAGFVPELELELTAEFTTPDGDGEDGPGYGGVIDLETDDGVEVETEEHFLFMRGRFGRLSLGREDPAASVLLIPAPAVGSGLADGDFDRYVAGAFNTEADYIGGDADLGVTYLTPQVGGLQAGFSYAPEALLGVADGFEEAEEVTDAVSFGANHFIDFGEDWEMGLSIGLNYARAEGEAEDDLFEWGIGAAVDYGGIVAGGFFIDAGSSLTNPASRIDEQRFWGVGLVYEHDDDDDSYWAVGINYVRNDLRLESDFAVGIGAEYEVFDDLLTYAELVLAEDDGLDNQVVVVVLGAALAF